MGFIPVLLNLRTILNNMKACQEEIRQYRPDVVILIDYPGFNLKIAKYVKTQLGLPVYYYISPKIWLGSSIVSRFPSLRGPDVLHPAFRSGVFPQSRLSGGLCGQSFGRFGCCYREKQAVGPDTFREDEQLDERPVLALLAGSRRQEIKDNLPTMLKVATAYPATSL